MDVSTLGAFTKLQTRTAVRALTATPELTDVRGSSFSTPSSPDPEGTPRAQPAATEPPTIREALCVEDPRRCLTDASPASPIIYRPFYITPCHCA